MTEVNNLNEVNLTTLTKLQWLSLVWAFTWKGFIITLGSLATSGIFGLALGFLIGFLGIMVGIDPEILKPTAKPLGFVFGIIVGYLFLIV